MIIPNMVNKTSTVLMTFFTGYNPVDTKFERHGRSPYKVVVGGAKGFRFWLVQGLNLCLHQHPITKVCPWTSLEFDSIRCVRVWERARGGGVCSAGGRQGRKEWKYVWLLYSLTSEDCVWTKLTWQPLVKEHTQNPAEPISARKMACECHLFSDIVTFTVWRLSASRGDTEHENITAVLITGPHGVEGRLQKGVFYECVIVWHWFTITKHCTLTLPLLRISWLQKCDWGSRHPSSVFGGLWKITIFARQLAKEWLQSPNSAPFLHRLSLCLY